MSESAPVLPQDEAHRLHPWTLLQKFVTSIPGFILAVLPMLSAGGGLESWLFIGTAVLYWMLVLPLILLRYRLFRYWITPDEIVIRSGVFTRQNRNIPIERVQNVVVQQNLMARLTRTAQVKVETAGSSATEGVLEYVSLAEARRLREVIRRYQKQQHAPALEPEPDAAIPQARPEPAVETEEDLLLRLPWQDVLLAGALRISLVYFAFILFPLQYVDVSPELVERWLRRGVLRPFIDFAMASPWLLIALVTVASLLLAWLTSIVVTLNQFWDFRLSRTTDKLHTRAGLLTLALNTIPLKKVQAAVLVANPLMRRFRFWRLELQTTGHDQKQGRRVAVPFAPQARLLDLAPQVYPFTPPDAFQPVSRKTIRRGFIRYSFFLVLVTAAAAWVWRPALALLVLWPALWGMAVLRWRNMGYAVEGGRLFVRRGLLRHTVWTASLEKGQAFFLSANLFQRRLGLASVYVDTAGDADARAFIVDLPRDEAEALMQMIYARFQSHFQDRQAV